MKRQLSYLLFLVFLLSLLYSCATDKAAYVPAAEEEIYGTWINEKEDMHKVVMYPNGTWEAFIFASDTSPFECGTYQLYKKWKDSQGNTWYYNYFIETLHSGRTTKVQELDRIYREGKVWVWESCHERVNAFDPDKFPAEINPESETYNVYYRPAEQ